MRKWPWRVREESNGINEPSSVNTLTSPPLQPSRKIFHSGIKLLHNGENSELE